MKNLFKNTLLAVAIVSLFTACSDSFFGQEVSGPIEEQTLVLEDFTGVDLGLAGDVYITKGSDFSIVVEAQQEVLNHLNHDIRSGIWEISLDKNLHRYEKVMVYITMPELDYLNLSGAGEIISTDNWTSDVFTVRIPGSGNIELDITANQLNCNISGAGDLQLSGEAKYHQIKVSGVSNIKAYELQSEQVNSNVTGSANEELSVSQKLEVSISGSANIYYKGSPSVKVTKSGSGKVVPVI